MDLRLHVLLLLVFGLAWAGTGREGQEWSEDNWMMDSETVHETVDFEHLHEPTDVPAILRLKRSSVLGLCRFCCRCCKKMKGCGMCCRT
ncbi:hepcidin-1-like [Ambystoma mexicanum]|uniref:hepcidin-1-like n=1 Tax=Ambystoma mexicanum TaxID=8296 RepID=UPI0037E7154E